jgi:hypothetical protein
MDGSLAPDIRRWQARVKAAESHVASCKAKLAETLASHAVDPDVVETLLGDADAERHQAANLLREAQRIWHALRVKGT